VASSSSDNSNGDAGRFRRRGGKLARHLRFGPDLGLRLLLLLAHGLFLLADFLVEVDFLGQQHGRLRCRGWRRVPFQADVAVRRPMCVLPMLISSDPAPTILTSESLSFSKKCASWSSGTLLDDFLGNGELPTSLERVLPGDGGPDEAGPPKADFGLVGEVGGGA